MSTAYLIAFINSRTGRIDSVGIRSEWPLTTIHSDPIKPALLTQHQGDDFDKARKYLLKFVRSTPQYHWACKYMSKEVGPAW